MNKKYLLLIIALSMLSVNWAKAQSLLVDTIVVTTTQIPMKINETGRNITVLTAKQIQSLPATSLDEILQTVSGLEVQSRGGFGVQGDISLRGATFTQVLIFLDGMKLNDPLTGHFNSYIPITPAEIERIEILRGAAAAMYGADAVGGVINIISKGFSHQKEGIDVSGTLNYGDHKLINSQQGFSVKKGAMTFGGGFSMNQSEGEFFPEKIIDATTTLTAYNNFFDIKTVSASFGYQFNNGIQLNARSAYDYRDFGARYFYTSSPFDKSTETVANWWNQIQLKKVGTASVTDFNVAYKYNTDEFIFSPDFPSTNNHTTQLFNITLNHLFVLNNKITLKTGGQLDNRKVESNDRGNHEDLHAGAYLMGIYRDKRVNLSASLRGDYDQNYEFELSPQVNFSYVLPSIVLRASVGRSIRAADYTERYVSNNLMNLTAGRSLGNPDLLAETSWSEELGFDYTLQKNWKIKATVFARQSSNLIDFVSTNQRDIGSVSMVGSLRENANYFFAKNITSVNTEGFEIESQYYQPLNGNAFLQWDIGYTYLNTTNEEEVVSVYISSHAKHLLTTQFLLNKNAFDLAVSGLYKKRNGRVSEGIQTQLADDYMVWNVRLGLKVTDNFGFNFQVQNIFNQSYQNILGAEMPRRWVMGGLKWQL